MPDPSLASQAVYGVPRADRYLTEAAVSPIANEVMTAFRAAGGDELPKGMKIRTMHTCLRVGPTKYASCLKFVEIINLIRRGKDHPPLDVTAEIVGAECFVDGLQRLLDMARHLRPALSDVTGFEPDVIEAMCGGRRVPDFVADHVLAGAAAVAARHGVPFDKRACFVSRAVRPGKGRKDVAVVPGILAHPFVREPDTLPAIS